jgi:hypothetical protein
VEIALPILVANFYDGRIQDLCVYASVGEIEDHLEEIDVENQEYTAWDAAGVLLALEVDRSAPPPHWLKITSTSQDDRERLLTTIREYARDPLAQVDPAEWPPELLAEAAKVRGPQGLAPPARRRWWWRW